MKILRIQNFRGVMLISQVLLVGFCFIYAHVSAEANGENVPGSHIRSDEDSPQFHDKVADKRRHLLAHLADRMDLDGEGLRHIQKHFSQQTGDTKQNQDLKDVAGGDNIKGIFYFFKFHDYDNNQKLDGLEWMQALTDFHEEDDNKDELKLGGKTFLEHEAEAIVDELLSKHDKNDDGMIDFLELMDHNVTSFMTDLDKLPPEGHEQQQQNVEAHSSLEQEFSKLQQAQKDQTQGQLQDQQQRQQQWQDQQQQQDNQQHDPQSQDSQQRQEDHHQLQQQLEKEQQEPSSEQTQGDQMGSQEQLESQQQNEPSSLEEEYNRQQQKQSK